MRWRKNDVISEAGTLHFHFMGEYSKLDRVKTIGSHGKINTIRWNIKINLQKLVDICGYELSTNLQNFTLKDLTEVKIFQKVLGGLLFLKHPVCHDVSSCIVTWPDSGCIPLGDLAAKRPQPVEHIWVCSESKTNWSGYFAGHRLGWS